WPGQRPLQEHRRRCALDRDLPQLRLPAGNPRPRRRIGGREQSAGRLCHRAGEERRRLPLERWRRQLASRQLQVESAPARLLLHEHLRRSHQPRRRVCPRGRCPLGLARWRRNFSKLHTPHGDNHIVWVNPNDPNVLLEGNDGGATVSTDGGKTWSTEHNQPTGQFYHVALDEQFPFHIYGAQQDEGSFEGPSATSEGMVPLSDWRRVAYGESTF